jgi:FkbM family methyltransferase
VETIFRLVGPHETVIDVGANIGFMTAAALSAVRTANVIAFEPHPKLFDRLSRNHELWVRDRPDISGRLRLEPCAVSDRSHVAKLYVSRDFAGNQGIATLEDGCSESDAIAVNTVTLDDYLGIDKKIGLMKIDIEGHELALLTGAAKVLESGNIRDILYEDHVGIDSGVSRRLSDYGYRIFFVAKLPWGPWLCDTRTEMQRARAMSFDSPNYLATLDPDRARRLVTGIGYQCIN